MKRGFSVLLLTVMGCTTQNNPADQEKWKSEIAATEEAFVAMAKEKGITEAFLHFAAEDATILRNDTLYKGKEEIKASFGRASSGDVELTWTMDFVDVSASGDLGYTYGQYTFTSTDSPGNKTARDGIFHTVWKRQQDGSWKFVWD
jgi:ketosteroid isomerase-like protein